MGIEIRTGRGGQGYAVILRVGGGVALPQFKCVVPAVPTRRREAFWG